MTAAGSLECAAVLAGVSAYLDGDLDPSECDAIERHCQTCASCAVVAQGVRDTIGLCRGAAIAPIPPSVRRKAQASIRALLNRSRS